MEKEIDRAIKELEQLDFVEKIFPFGHVADGNIHFIIGKKDNSPEIIEAINAIIYAKLSHYKGSVSAEHGIGLDKKPISAPQEQKVKLL